MSAYRRLTNRFCYGKRFLNVGGGGGCGGWGVGVLFKKATIHFSENPVVWKDVISNINLGQTNSLNLNKFSIGSNIPDCLSAPFPY